MGACANTCRMGAPAFGVWLAAAADSTADDASWTRATRLVPHSLEVAQEHDVSLLERLRLGEEGALRELMTRYAADVMRVAFHYVRDASLAHEVAQDVFVAVWERRHLLDARTPLVHYLRRAGRNRALNVLRDDAARVKLAEQIGRDTDARIANENEGPHSVHAAEIDATIRRIVTTLTPRVQEVLLLYYERGLEPGEIAATLGVAPRTVYNQLRTALRRLADALAAHDSA
jgi:RNA polymerase sigma-70 factor (ECF subfamily)